MNLLQINRNMEPQSCQILRKSERQGNCPLVHNSLQNLCNVWSPIFARVWHRFLSNFAGTHCIWCDKWIHKSFCLFKGKRQNFDFAWHLWKGLLSIVTSHTWKNNVGNRRKIEGEEIILASFQPIALPSCFAYDLFSLFQNFSTAHGPNLTK